MLTTVLVPLDGSALAAQALPFAERIAGATGAKMLLVRATVDFNESMLSRASVLQSANVRERVDQIASETDLAEVASRIRENGISVATCVQPGPAGDVILEVARSRQADLIVMSTHGRGGVGRLLYGSVADQVLRGATIPVLLVPPDCNRPWPTDRPLRVVLTLDGSRLSEAAIDPASELARALGAELYLVRVVRQYPASTRLQAPEAAKAQLEADLAETRAYLRAVASRLRAGAYTVAVRAPVGFPAGAIATIAREQDADLIAMATHGRGGLGRVVLGSVATDTLQQTSVPLLLIRPTTSEAADASASMSEQTAEPTPSVRATEQTGDSPVRGERDT